MAVELRRPDGLSERLARATPGRCRRVPGVGTPVRGGVTYREAHSALETVAERDEDEGVLRSLEVVEVNPILDESNETAELATELAASGLGKSIL